MEINKTIKIKDKRFNTTLEVKIRNILDVVKSPGYITLIYWHPEEGKKASSFIFDDEPLTWCDKDGNESADYQKLIDTLSVYAEQTKLKDAIAYLN